MAAEYQDTCIVLSGPAGQGIQTVETILTSVLRMAGLHVFATKEYMSRIRGGNNTTAIRVSGNRVQALLRRIDILAALDANALDRVRERIRPDTVILAENPPDGGPGIARQVAFTEIATRSGNRLYSNTVAAGALLGTLGIPRDFLNGYLRRFFSRKGEDVVRDNIRAAGEGYRAGTQHATPVALPAPGSFRKELVLNGTEAVALGALAGGCNFLSSYPMSPSTGVLTFFSAAAEEAGIVVEQAEDEISAVNMAVGAWYAGGRALVTTSGGGFALMVEGLSLAGAVESPLVVHLAQRPGPATGLPTRTEQADLFLALHAGHGEFPRILLAPGTIEQGFLLTRRAFNLAARYQVPVLILTDQHFLDSFYNIPDLPIEGWIVRKNVVETDETYLRYRLTEDGVSPRGIPGHGKALVYADSDEHTEKGLITEDAAIRKSMVDKRLRKREQIKEQAESPELIGNPDYRILVVSWGSTRNAVAEAAAATGRDDVSVLHFPQVYPLPASAGRYLGKASRVISVENNATGQFADLLSQETGTTITDRILKYDGHPFSVEELAEELQSRVEEP